MPAPPNRNLDDTRDRLTEWLAKRLPAAQDLRILDLRGPSATGFSSDTLLFALERSEAGSRRSEDLVVRLEPTGFQVFPEYDVALQYRIMKGLADTNVPVPRMRWLEEDRGPLGVPFYVMDRVEGIVPTDTPPYHTGGWVFELPPSDRETLWWSGLEAMTRIHRLDWRALGFDFLEETESSDTTMTQHLQYYDDYIEWGIDRRRYPLLEAGLKWLRANQPEESAVRLCWGDSRVANQIFRDLECVAVIDWEMVRLGNPALDLGWWTTLDRCLSEGIGVPRIPGLPDRDATRARWEARTGLSAEPFPFYEVFAAFRFAVIMARIALQLKHYEVIPQDHEMDVDNLASATLARLLGEVGA